MATTFYRAPFLKWSVIIVFCVLIGIVFSMHGKKNGGSTTNLLFVGDMMFDRTLRSIAERNGYEHLFSCVGDYLNTFDVVIGNLEGPVTPYGSRSAGTKPGEDGNTSFTFDSGVLPILAKHHVSIVHLGNNHIADFGREGISMTEKNLADNNISYFGAPDSSISLVRNIGDKKIAFVSFNQFLGHHDPQKTVDAIWKAKRDADFVVVYAHWGEEYVEPTAYMKSVAHRFIDSGADLVIGSHPHIVQDHEIYQEKHIYYSLGNFMFDQYWNEEVRIGKGIELTLRGKEVLITEESFEMKRNGQTCLLSSK